MSSSILPLSRQSLISISSKVVCCSSLKKYGEQPLIDGDGQELIFGRHDTLFIAGLFYLLEDLESCFFFVALYKKANQNFIPQSLNC